MLTLTEYKQITEHIKQLTVLKTQATDAKQRAHLTKRIRSLNARVARAMQQVEV